MMIPYSLHCHQFWIYFNLKEVPPRHPRAQNQDPLIYSAKKEILPGVLGYSQKLPRYTKYYYHQLRTIKLETKDITQDCPKKMFIKIRPFD